MKRRLFNFAAAASLLLALGAAAAWAMSYARPSAWRLIGTAHSADLTRVDSGRRTLLFTTNPGWSNAPHHGFWDAWWSRSESGKLTLLAQVIDYDGTLRRVYALPPALTVDPPVQPGAQAVVFGRMPAPGRWERWLGFALHSDTQAVAGLAGPVSARGWMVTLPWWFILLTGLPLPLVWLRTHRATSRRP